MFSSISDLGLAVVRAIETNRRGSLDVHAELKRLIEILDPEYVSIIEPRDRFKLELIPYFGDPANATIELLRQWGVRVPGKIERPAVVEAVAVDPLPAAASVQQPDESAWVRSTPSIWNLHFRSNKELDKFRNDHPDMFRNNGRQLLIHMGKWTAHWIAHEKAGFDALDGNLPSVADDPNIQDEALAEAMQRAAAIRTKKQAGKR